MIHDGLNEPRENPIHSFLLIGQSNMAGRGVIGDVPPIENENCRMLRMGRWQKMREPINTDRGIFEGKVRSGVSLGASFADEVAKRMGWQVGLIPCADGGTRIDQWKPGEILFDHAVMMAKLAMRTSTLSGILWHQGESDCHSDEGCLAHKEKFHAMITALRRELCAEELPLIIGELSHWFDPKYELENRHLTINRQYHDLAAELSPCAIVSSEGLSMKPDGLHFDAAAQRIFGVRYADAYLSLL
ncbi:MAG: sialate O-acetylesterase [Clostridia bacterium]|nr:sialate O-acetylesterase [Clostridia bacterium]